MNDYCESPGTCSRFDQLKTWVIRFGCFFISIVVVFLLGPRVHVDPTIRLTNSRLLQDIDAYLVSEESRYSPLPGTEKTVIWRFEDHRRTRFSLVYIHGFSASRQESMPVPSDLANRLNANLFATRLTAHGCGSEAFATVTVNDWLNDVHEAVAIGKRLGDRVVLVGTSTGGTLALWMANQDPDIAAVVLLSPNFGIQDKNSAYALYPWGQQIVKAIQGPYSGFTPKNELHQHFWTTRYRTEGAVQMLALVDYCRRQDFHQLKVPCLCIYSEMDPILDTAEIVTRMNEVDSNKKVIVWSGSSRHVLAGDILSPETNQRLVEEIMQFLTEYLRVGEGGNSD